MPPYSLCLGCVKLFRAEDWAQELFRSIEHLNWWLCTFSKLSNCSIRLCSPVSVITAEFVPSIGTQQTARSRTSVFCEYMWTLIPFPATYTACKIMIVSTSSCVFTPVLHDFPSLQWHFCGSRSPGSQHYYDWWVIEPGTEWVNILCHYWNEICVCPDASSIFYRKIPLYKIAFPWTCLSDVPLLLTWLGTHCCSYQRLP